MIGSNVNVFLSDAVSAVVFAAVILAPVWVSAWRDRRWP